MKYISIQHHEDVAYMCLVCVCYEYNADSVLDNQHRLNKV